MGGDFLRRIGEHGSLPHHLSQPMCVALSRDNEEHIIVTDSVNAAVKIFKQNGDFIVAYGDNTMFEFPCGLAVTSHNYIVVSDVCKHCIIVMHRNGEVRNTFGNYGDKITDLDQPYFLCVDQEDRIIISDFGNTSIKIFNIDGIILQYFTQLDFKLHNEHYVTLHGITVDPDGHIVVIGNSSVYIAANNGRFWEVLLPSDGLFSPRGIAYSNTGHLIITEYDEHHKHQVSMFKYNTDDFYSLNSVPALKLRDSSKSSNISGTTAKDSVDGITYGELPSSLDSEPVRFDMEISTDTS